MLVPIRAAQGELIAVRFSAFPHNALVRFALNNKWLIKRGQYQAGLVDSIDYKIPEGLPDGDYDIVGENGVGSARVAASGRVHVAGQRLAPTLEAVAVPPPDDRRGWYRIGVHRIHVKGLRWTLGAGFMARLWGVGRDGQVDTGRGTPWPRHRWMAVLAWLAVSSVQTAMCVAVKSTSSGRSKRRYHRGAMCWN